MHKSDEPWINPGIVILCRQITQLQTKGLNFGKNLRLYAKVCEPEILQKQDAAFRGKKAVEEKFAEIKDKKLIAGRNKGLVHAAGPGVRHITGADMEGFVHGDKRIFAGDGNTDESAWGGSSVRYCPFPRLQKYRPAGEKVVAYCYFII